MDYNNMNREQLIAELVSLQNQFNRSLGIAANRQTEKREKFRSALLKLFILETSRRDYLDAVIKLISELIDCSCIGVRVLDPGGNIPYESYTGFPRTFWERENWLSINDTECVCTRVIRGTTMPVDHPFINAGGSFYCPDTSMLPMEDPDVRVSYRGTCIETGFATVAVIPIRYRDKINGAIHLADKKANKIEREDLILLETVAPLIGEAINRFGLEEDLKRNLDIQKTINKILNIANKNSGIEEFLSDTMEILISVPWLTKQTMGCVFLADNNNMLRMITHYGIDRKTELKCARVPFGHCVCGKAASTKKIEYGCHLDKTHEKQHQKAIPHGNYCIPILVNGNTVGVINLFVQDIVHKNPYIMEFLTTIAGALSGILEHKQTEKALFESEQRFRTLVNSMDDIVYTLDRNQRIMELYGNSSKRLGIKPEEFIGKKVGEILDYEAAQIHEAANEAALNGDNVLFEWRWNGPAGRRHYQTSLSPIRGAENNIIGLVGVGRDVTESKKRKIKLYSRLPYWNRSETL